MRKTIRKLAGTVAHYDNWPVRFLELAHLAPKRLMKLKISGGAAFFVRPYSSDVSCLQSITRAASIFATSTSCPGTQS